MSGLAVVSDLQKATSSITTQAIERPRTLRKLEAKTATSPRSKGRGHPTSAATRGMAVKNRDEVAAKMTPGAALGPQSADRSSVLV